MGYHARVSADAVDLTGFDMAQLMEEAPRRNIPPGGPISGFVLRNGKPIPFTLETANMTAEAYRILPEQLVMAGLLALSFLVPIFHLFG